MFLAAGLRAQNGARAIQQVRPCGVGACSGLRAVVTTRAMCLEYARLKPCSVSRSSGGIAGSSGAAGTAGSAGLGSGGAAGDSSGGSGGTSAAESCVFEAENYSSQKGYAKVSHSGASGGIAMRVGASGSLNFELNLKVGGRYYVWLRTQAANTESNGLFISVDGNRIKAPAGHKLAGVSDIYLNW